jgi:hypothetical protein
VKQLIIFAILVFSSLCLAQEQPKLELDVRSTLLDNKPFVCFEPKGAQILLQFKLDSPKLNEKIKYLEALATIRDQEVQSLLRGATFLKDQTALLEQQRVDLQKQLDSSNSIWKSPVLWFAVGVIVSGGVSLAIALTR